MLTIKLTRARLTEPLVYEVICSQATVEKGKEGLKTLFCLSTHSKKWSWGKYINLLYIGKNQKISNAPCRVIEQKFDTFFVSARYLKNKM
jgi:hypothetical protein